MQDTLAAILDTHPDVIVRYDTDTRLTYANKAACAFFGRSHEDLMKESVLGIASDEGRERIARRLGKLTPEDPTYTSVQHMEHSGRDFSLVWTNTALFEGDTLVGYQSVGRDMTERLQLDEELQDKTRELAAAQRELREVIDAVPALIWYKDESNLLLRVNKAAADTLGMSVEEVEGRSTYELFGEAAKGYHDDDLMVIRSGEALRGRIEPFTPKDGEQGWVQTDKIPLTDGPDGPRILAVSTDITEMKEKEALLESINRNLDDFASMASHDLQGPLRRISISAELLQMELDVDPQTLEHDYFKDIAGGVQRMRTLIQSFLRFMRGSPNAVELHPVDLAETIRKVVEEEKPSIDEVGGRVTLRFGPMHVRADAALISQVFTNLITNCVKYRSPDRPLDISIESETMQQYWVIRVRDNGSGIEDADAGHIFNIFARAKPHAGVEGAGIGLALCRRITDLHGGTIEHIPTEEDGSVFEVKLFKARRPEHG